MNLYSRISRILLLIYSIARVFSVGVANKIPKNISNIVVVPSGKLGDVVCTTPVLSAIRTHLPNAHITVLGDAKLHKQLLANSNLVDSYIDIKEKGVLKKIKRVNADAALITGPSFIPTALLYISGIPFVVAPKVAGGISPAETRPYNILKKFITTFPYQIGKYAPRERLKCLELLSIVSSDTKKILGFSEEAGKKISQFFIENNIDTEKDFVVGVSPSVGNEIKKWPEERFAEVADYLIEKYQAKIVLFGGVDDKEEIQEVIRNIKNPESVVNTQGRFSIDELKACISKLKLFVSVDTGPIYIAEAFNVPTIDIVGPMDEREQPPIGERHRVVVPNRDKPALHILTARLYDRKEARRQAENITSDMVITEINTLLKEQEIRS
ncbi:glycosyltransferase family 9 protein [Candidatus Woesearchaeota archaeon]|jgi:heptosyltransferase II|nr:glycosyltransferase family 9 protein [Candidatus Woesearchaeota archaeon]MBT4733070.1 glycosyltransferase family 9 protein [Candidatus Woesearchaeota archaeon]